MADARSWLPIALLCAGLSSLPALADTEDDLAKQLAGTNHESREAYAHAKTGFIERVVALAMQSGYPGDHLEAK